MTSLFCLDFFSRRDLRAFVLAARAGSRLLLLAPAMTIALLAAVAHGQSL